MSDQISRDLGSPQPASKFFGPPTRLLILSDLHLEFGDFQPPDPWFYDVVILAGDIHLGDEGVRWARRTALFDNKPVIYVPGNHEFYSGVRPKVLKLIREAAQGTNVHVLDQDEVIIRGIRFLGATLWTDFAVDSARGVEPEDAMRAARRGLNDFLGAIREPSDVPGLILDQFSPAKSAELHASSRAWLADRLAAPVDPTAVSHTVVVSHHGPSYRSLDTHFAGSDLNPCYYSELPVSFFQSADLWVHGHTHSSVDYQHHRTRVVGNPRGYMHWDGQCENRQFKSDFIVSLGKGDGHE